MEQHHISVMISEEEIEKLSGVLYDGMYSWGQK